MRHRKIQNIFKPSNNVGPVYLADGHRGGTEESDKTCHSEVHQDNDDRQNKVGFFRRGDVKKRSQYTNEQQKTTEISIQKSIDRDFHKES